MEGYLPTAEMFAADSTMTFPFKGDETLKLVTFYMIYAKPEPSFDITGYYMDQGSQKDIFVNGKPLELIGASEDRLSKDMDVYLSLFKGKITKLKRIKHK